MDEIIYYNPANSKIPYRNIVRLSPREVDELANVLHQVNKHNYDTPASVSGCPCNSCNASREIYGKTLLVPNVDRTYFLISTNSNKVDSTIQYTTLDQAQSIADAIPGAVVKTKTTFLFK